MTNDTRTAILKAADQIETHPELYNYDCVKVPDCGTPGCALGWIAVFRGHKARMPNGERVCFSLDGNPVKVSSTTFYRRMDCLASRDDQCWRDNAGACARILRAYADRHHPPPVQQTPDWQQMAADLSRADRISEDA